MDSTTPLMKLGLKIDQRTAQYISYLGPVCVVFLSILGASLNLDGTKKVGRQNQPGTHLGRSNTTPTFSIGSFHSFCSACLDSFGEEGRVGCCPFSTFGLEGMDKKK